MAGTFLVLVMHPEVAFQDGNPFLLTVEGEFVIKNLVLLSAALVIGSRLAPIGEVAPAAPDDAERLGSPAMETAKTVDVDLEWVEELTKRETEALDESTPAR